MADAERVASAAEASTSGRDSAGEAPEPAPQAAQAPAAPAPVVAFAKKARRGNIRKRPADADAEDVGGGDGEGSAVVRKQRARPDNPLAFSTKRPEEDKAELFKFESSGTLQQTTDQRATATLETETDFAHDARALREQVLAQATADAEAGVLPNGDYKGLNNYTDYKKGFRREHTIAAEKGGGMHGPLRANVYARVSCRFDYQPDICKDYKETGFCGYGDACKFVHDRSDYKGGWEIEKEWEEQQKKKQNKALAGWAEEEEGGAAAANADSDSDAEELPFACYSCRRQWEECDEPVVTRCRHYYCTNCALRLAKQNHGRCAVCEVPTSGIFNIATDIQKRMKEQKRKAAASAAS